jgi:hypothetical protein
MAAVLVGQNIGAFTISASQEGVHNLSCVTFLKVISSLRHQSWRIILCQQLMLKLLTILFKENV